MKLSQNLFSFKGRIARLPLLGYTVFSLAGVAAIIGIGMAVVDQAALFGLLLFGIAFILYMWMSFALNVKRLHDLGKPGSTLIWICAANVVFAILAAAVPPIGVVGSLFQLGCAVWLLTARGEPYPNAYGEPPGAITVPAMAPSGPTVA